MFQMKMIHHKPSSDPMMMMTCEREQKPKNKLTRILQVDIEYYIRNSSQLTRNTKHKHPRKQHTRQVLRCQETTHMYMYIAMAANSQGTIPCEVRVVGW